MNKKIKWGLLVLIVVVLAGLAIRTWLPRTNKELTAADTVPRTSSSNARRALNVNGVIIKPQSLTEEITINGRLLPDEEVDLAFETSGKVVAIYFEEGTLVKKGQLLAKVNDLPLQAQLQRLEAQVKLAEDRVFRQSALLEKDAVSKEAYEQVRTDQAILEADIEIIKANIAQTELRAPFDGIIGLRQISEGSFASTSTVVAKLTKISPLKIEFAVPERYASQIQRGTNLTFSVEGRLTPMQAQVYATESQIDQSTFTLPVRAYYPNTNGALLPGRYASVQLKMREISNAIAIPTEAIVPEMGLDKVFLYRSGRAYPVEVTTGLRTESEVQVLEGLHMGDTIITTGTLQLRMDLEVILDNVE
ncbi:MAG: efflux RND transporter periplasmic adaptor subunit [Bacteroides sp.]|nr:efflux RND transporter periplasmic adaptor subunit [Bacteroides sp.]MCD8081711.1 efflux RND transporter periplasmic adaptor subunit [Bacteroides sp.]